MSALAELKHEWQEFKHDAPGTRFKKHHRRTKQHASTAGKAGRILLGLVLLAGGGVMLFVPGPGLLVIVFGLGLLASMSSKLAGVLDRLEPLARRAWNVVRRMWRRLPLVANIALCVVAAGGAAAMGYAAWRQFFA